MAPHRFFDPPFGFRQAPPDQGLVDLGDSVGLELGHQGGVGQGRPGHHDEAAGVFIQPVHQARAAHLADVHEVRAVVHQGVEQGPIPVPGPGMDHQPRGLVHHQQVPVFKENGQGQGFGGEVAGRGRRHAHHNGIARPHPVGGRARLPVDQDPPGFHQLLQPGPGPPQGLGQELVQAGAGLARLHHLP